MGFLEFAWLQCAPQSVLVRLPRVELLSGSQVPAPCSMGGRERGKERGGRFIMCSRCSSHLSALLWNAVELIRLHLRQV